jgi:oligoendopeptidase F
MPKLNTSKNTWDLSPLLAGDNDPNIHQYRKTIEEATVKFVDTWRGREDYLQDPSALKEALDELEAWQRIPGNGSEAFYFGLRTSQDSISTDIKAKDNQATEFTSNIHNQFQFFWINIGKISPEIQAKFLYDKQLEPYRHILERTFAAAKYRLSEMEEKILLLKSNPAHTQWVQMTNTFLSKEEREVLAEDGQKKIVAQAEILGLLSSQKKPVRDSAADALNDVLQKNVNIAETELNAVLSNKKIDDDLRGYDRPDKPRHIEDDISTEVVDALVEAVSSRNAIPQRFYGLKAKLLGLKKLAYHERTVPYGQIEKEYTYADAAQIVDGVFAGLDPEFAQIFRYMLENGQFDVFPQKGKRGGAFCAGYHITHPTYVLLNFTGKLQDVLTIAHEMGHAVNNELIKKSQNALNYETPLSTAEVASTFMEDFVLEKLAEEADEELQLALMVSQLDDQIATIFRQIALYRFEQELHRDFRIKGYLSQEEIGKLFLKHMGAYMGPAVELSSGSQNWWVYWMHIRMFFYVYSYASGLLISKALQAKVRKDKAFISKVKIFLSTGVSKSPKDIFSEMGIDITDRAFWYQGLDEIERLLQDTEDLAKKLSKI